MIIDLDRHNLVEASAGTGKTYTIEQLVLRLLTEKEISLDRILVVTYTEKATGELKTRLRSRLEKEAAADSERRMFLQKNLEDFDQAPIFTIHSFCQRLLREFPLEQGEEFALELVNKADLLRPALREVQRLWPERYGDSLADLLRKAGYVGSAAESWEEKLIKVAGRYRPSWRHRLLPDTDTEPPEDVDALSTWLLIRTIKDMMEQIRHVQERRGLYTFDNLIERVSHALDKKTNRAADTLVARLRQRFACAIVDEFQDTDPLQWQILKRIFVEEGDGKLYVVGDPKQAIYGFTGADLPTYQRAKKELLNQYEGKLAPLETNWRSCPDMVRGLNEVFQAADWFIDKETEESTYRCVQPCPDDQAHHVVEDDQTGRGAINLVDLRGRSDKAAGMRIENARFVASEIARLLSRADCLRFRAKEQTRLLKPGDIAVLVRNRGEARPIAFYLRQRGIPFTIYKETGLWQSLDASQILYALEALALPDDRRMFHRLLLTNFFRLNACDLLQGELPDHHPARVLFQQWVELAERRAWGALFASLLEDSFMLGFEEDSAESTQDRERTLANLKHIFGALQHAAYRDGLDVHGLADFMRGRIRASDGEDGYHPIETNESKVQILTMHTSKGLEFPVVFLAGGFTKSRIDFIEYRDEDDCKIIDLDPCNDAKEKCKAEGTAEDGRLLYVALTRAIFKLYVPLLGKLQRAQWAGPLFTLLHPALSDAKLLDRSVPGISIVSTDDVSQAHAPKTKPASVITETARTLTNAVFLELDGGIFSRRIVMQSFTSLKRQMDRAEQLVYGDFRERADDDDLGPLEEPDPLRGAEFGDLVHRILEELDWADAARVQSANELWREGTKARTLLEKEMKATLPRIHSRMPRVSLEAMCREKVGQMIWHALTTPLEALKAPLCQLPAKDVLREIEFLFPGNQEDGTTFLTGFMDVVFRKEGKYYLLDWKTNQLDKYDRVALKKAMDETDYTRQYRLYALALERWLKGIHGSSFDLEKHLGGVFYLFLRGMTGANPREGVFFVKPKPADLKLTRILSV